ncbi:uroporphyrinogen-III synthase [Caldivirga maquilingensis]|uniref:Uroporphyrinogen III synthase HEM4 n=1 Tax=Caldivirga maquilingensis (strain ATCC 700844 / DSM 13496 / JCM 10307 / IC-167) TaxID=397948 RepID=A8MBI5_CALMQ|nr:uroporphyrinogen-III synthase [Caldivirga maquilingensis]ABW02718.1 Uroporphyrinogen III synthase HEM4 [Caldivirga maquilingensis IC-167]
MQESIIVIRAKGEEGIRGEGVIEVPVLKPIPDQNALRRLEELCSRRWDVVVFMSTVAVEYTYSVVKDPCWVRCMAVGPSTAAAVRRLYNNECLIPSEYSSMGLLRMLRGFNGSILVIRSMEYSNSLFNELGGVTEIGLYRLSVNEDELSKLKALINEREAAGSPYALIITSPRVAREVSGILLNLRRALIVAIGPTTAKELSMLNIPHSIAKVYTIDGAVNEAKHALSGGGDRI